MHKANAADVLSFIQAWNQLRRNVTKQVERVLEDFYSEEGWNEETEAHVVPKAIRHAARKLKPHNEEIGMILEDYLDEYDRNQKAA